MRSERDEPLSTGKIELFGDRITACGKEFPVNKIKDMAVQGYNRLTIYTDDGEFVIDMQSRANAVKYMICGYHLKNTALGLTDGHYGY